MPDGKPANTPCIQLDEQQRCKIFLSPLRPKVCAGLQPSAEMCGQTRQQAMTWLIELEALTAP
ncbi:yeiW [Escherichia fergusonii B253]|nr:yeiW [Escherichia fergusonii B253]